jgi:hypothetical protein
MENPTLTSETRIPSGFVRVVRVVRDLFIEKRRKDPQGSRGTSKNRPKKISTDFCQKNPDIPDIPDKPLRHRRFLMSGLLQTTLTNPDKTLRQYRGTPLMQPSRPSGFAIGRVLTRSGLGSSRTTYTQTRTPLVPVRTCAAKGGEQDREAPGAVGAASIGLPGRAPADHRHQHEPTAPREMPFLTATQDALARSCLRRAPGAGSKSSFLARGVGAVNQVVDDRTAP